jgi:hypothetical protein
MLSNSSPTSRRAIALSLVLFMSVWMIGTNRMVPPVRAQNEACSQSQTHHLTKKSGNGVVANPCNDDAEVTFDSGGMVFVPAKIVDPNVLFFPYDVIPTTNWVAMTCDRMGADNSFFTYRTFFTLPECFSSPSISVQVHSDNAAEIFVNGNSIGAQTDAEIASNFQDPPEVISSSNPLIFQSGPNVLEFRVHNFGAQITALDFLADICYGDCVVQTCRTCNEGVVVVDVNTTVDLNPAVPTCSGDPDLCAFFTFDKTGPISNWKAIFDVGANKLLIKNGATVTVVPGPPNGGNNKQSPGIVIKSTCDIEIEKGGAVVVQSINKQAGDILIQANGNITIGGTVSNSVTGTNGRPGNITIASCCGGIRTGPFSVIETVGVDFGGSDINIVTCGGGETAGNIAINGLVDASYKAAPASTINIAAFNGFVAIDGTNLLGIEAGTQRPITSGVTVRSRRDPVAGTIKIQARDDIRVTGNTLLDKNHPNYGAVAVKPTSTNGTSGDGAIIAVSTGGNILALDRAFDIANRFNLKNDITLFAAQNIRLLVSASIDNGAADNTKPVVNSQGGSAGKGGTNTLRAFSGGILIGLKAQVLANFVGTPGSNGVNLLTACVNVINSGTVNPPDAVPADDTGVCGGAPDPLFPEGCEFFKVCGTNRGN